jgi:hypothetical protein
VADVLVLVRVWGLHVAVPLAVAEGLAAWVWWDGAAVVPTVDRPIPLIVVLPAALVLSVTWVLAERWPDAVSTAARSVTRVRIGRFGAVLVTCVASAAVAGLRANQLDVVAVTVVGVGLAGAVAPWLTSWLWLPLAFAGYGWLQVCAHNHTGDCLPLGVPIAIGAAAAGAAVYACWPRQS